MKLYELGPTRSIRARWLQELGVEFEAIVVNLERMYVRPNAPKRIAALRAAKA